MKDNQPVPGYWEWTYRTRPDGGWSMLMNVPWQYIDPNITLRYSFRPSSESDLKAGSKRADHLGLAPLRVNVQRRDGSIRDTLENLRALAENPGQALTSFGIRWAGLLAAQAFDLLATAHSDDFLATQETVVLHPLTLSNSAEAGVRIGEREDTDTSPQGQG
jgi:hypothetical protein